MATNRLLSLNKELKTFKRGKKVVTAKSLYSRARQSDKQEEKVSDTIVADDVFVTEILDYFFQKKLSEDQLTDELRKIAAKCLWEATKASRVMDLVPRPPKSIPSPTWLVSEAVQIGYRRARNKGIYKAVKDTVSWKWRRAFDIALIESETAEAQSLVSEQMDTANTALVVFIENTGHLPFQWESKVGKLVQEGLEKVVDYVAEEFSKWLNKFADARGKKYREVIILEDSKATLSSLKSTLHDLANRDFIIDVFTLAHGNSSSFSGYNGSSISDTDLRGIKDSYGKALPIRVVYMMNCKGAGLNDDWMYMGAKTTAGAVNNNYIPEPMMSKFWNNWLRGDTFSTAVNTAYDDSVKLIKDTIAKAESFIPLVGKKIKSALEAEINPLLSDSKPKVEGNGAVTIDTAKLVSAQSYSVAEEFYSHAKYDTGEHVLSGLVNEGAVSPTYQLDVKGVKFTYAEIIAMGDFYESYDQMAAASAAELAGLKSLIDRSKRYYEGKVTTGTPVGTNPTDENWQNATAKRYLKLAEDNFAHFAPSNSTYISFASSKSNHKREWDKYHTRAIDIMRKGVNSNATLQALPINAFGDHFLTDAFSAGHLFNKDDLSNYFKSLVMSGGKVNANGETMFGAIATKAFVGTLKSTFSQYETVEWKGIVFRPNINDADRFKKLLIGIMEKEPDVIGKTMVAKLIHDALNDYPGGVPVSNNVGDSWNLTGDGTLNVRNLEIMRKAVKQSIRNLSDSVNDKSPVSVFCKRVWDITPQPTSSGITVIKNTIRNFTNPLGTDIVNGADKLLQKNYQALIDELVKRKVLKKA
jgi:hypothetical protein